MNSRDQLLAFVKKVHRRLISEHLFRVTQTALSFSLFVTAIVFLASRLFVFPFYVQWAMGAGGICFALVFVWGVYRKPTYSSSMLKFDHYFPENLLITSLHSSDNESGLLLSLRDKTAKMTKASFDVF